MPGLEEHNDKFPLLTDETRSDFIKKGVLEIFSDPKCIEILYTFNNKKLTSNKIASEMKLTPKQFYTHISSLVNSGIVKDDNGYYQVTSFGKYILIIFNMINNAIIVYERLKSIDACRSI